VVRYIARIVIVGLFFAGGGMAMAQDGLYAPVRPGETALVRVVHVNAGEPAAGITIDVGNTRFTDVEAQSGTAYRPVRPGVYVVMAYGHREALTATTGTFYTVAVSPDGITIFSDTYHDDPLRAQLVLYNLSDAPLRLDAVVPEAPLLEAVAPGTSGTRVINAIPVTIAVSPATAAGSTAGPSGEGASNETPDDGRRYEVSLELERGASYGFMVQETPNVIAGFIVQAAVEGSAGE
jgi:hypothetical protein